MGTEFGQRREFSESRSIDWWQSAEWGHRGIQRLIKDMNTIYKEHPALWKRDTDPSGFSWIDADDRGGNVFSWLRFDGDGQMIACITNFSSEPRPDHQIGLPTEGVWKEILNTDAEVYDGTGSIGNLGQVIAHPVPSHGYVASASVTIPPLGAVWLRLEAELDEEQAIEPERATRGVIAAARAASPHTTTADQAVTGPTQPRRPKPSETELATEAAAAGSAESSSFSESAESPESADSPESPESAESPDSPDSPDSPTSLSSPASPRSP
jgi:1,4-alpha-glucan branching enzyme